MSGWDWRRGKFEQHAEGVDEGGRSMILRVLLVSCLAISLGTGVACADAIDGQWCLGGNHFEINGPNIRTPGGNAITGNYDRHGFVYVVPPNEEGAGTQIVMVLLNEETVRLTRGTAAPETWKRCKPVS
jgi:hypothetical protein